MIFDSPIQIIIARAVAGAGAAFIMPATLVAVDRRVPEVGAQQGRWYLGGHGEFRRRRRIPWHGMLLQFFPWQSIFYAFTAAAVGMFILTCTIGSSRDESATPIDWIGAVLIGAAVAVFVFGVVEAPGRGWTSPVVCGCMAAGVALAVAFAIVELRRTHPLLDIRLFGSPDFTTGAVGITFLFFANFGFFFVAMQYMQLMLGYSALRTAFALAPLAIPILVLGATIHLYLPKIGLRTAVALGLFLIAVGLFCMRVLGCVLVVSGVRVAHPHRQRGHRVVRCANDIGDHGRGPRREAGGCIGGQRHDT